MLEYVMLDCEEAFNRGLIDYKPSWRSGCVIFRVEDGKYYCLGNDWGEPEDKSFYRDFGWVLSELAYARDYHKKGQPEEVKQPENEKQAAIRSTAADYRFRRDNAATPEARSFYKTLLLDLTRECGHPSTVNKNSYRECSDCGVIL